ncbi:DUF551 domain-containing protein [Cronobacter malonaticus]|nr:DUF551 domain-containing protein [Cronobacter malonaticus]EGT4484512.1 DUF551 domain-containing protein [Cronobacter malonaticus]
MSEKSQERLIQIVAAAEKLVRCKGRYHSEQNYRALAALFGVTTPDLPPLESDLMRERAEPVYQVQAMDWHDVEKYLYDEALDRGIRCRVLYTAPPATVVPKIDRKAICNKAHWLCARSPGATFYNAAEFALDEVMELLAPPASVVAEPVSQPYKLPEGWIACSEQMPENGGLYLCYVQDEYEFDISYFCFEYLAAHKKFDSAGLNITHWMPLPAAPGKN